MEVQEVIKYMVRFPDRNGVLKNFKDGSETDADYLALKTYVETLPDPLMPDLKDFVVSTDEVELGERIRNINNYFLFLEYGRLNAAPPDKVRIRDLTFNIAVHVCYHSNKRGMDSMKEAIIMDRCLQMAFVIAKQMISDDNLICPHTRFAESAIAFDPVEPALLHQSIGWTLTFRKSNNLEL